MKCLILVGACILTIAALGTQSLPQSRTKTRPKVSKSTRERKPSATKITTGTVRNGVFGIEMVWIPPGEFLMGSTDAAIDEAYSEELKYRRGASRNDYLDERPKHWVTISKGFWMSTYEVTQEQWQSVMGENPSSFNNCGLRCPVENVSWHDVRSFIMRLNAKDTKFEYRLPSEAEWEYAARAGTASEFAFGDSLDSTQANFDGNGPYKSLVGTYIGKPVRVGSYKPNAWGLYDMHGNVWEWVEDVANGSYNGLPTDGSANLKIGDVGVGVIRGGSWLNYSAQLRSAGRLTTDWTVRTRAIGFRLVGRSIVP